MEYRRLGRSDIKVSALCLGTMTWGEQNSEPDGHRQMDYALDRGVNFWDTAEAYAVPPRRETYGRTEEIIGAWFAARGKRERIVLASKIAGPDPRFAYIRDGKLRFDRKNILAALEASLKRLRTDYIDLYQLHWPERQVNIFGQLGYVHDATEDWTPFAETLGVLGDCVKAGKIRAIGISNETPWGTMRWLDAAEAGAGPRMVSVQNVYSLVNRTFEIGMAEVAIRESCGLLAYSPLAMGILTGKYLNGVRPEGARLSLFKHFRYHGYAEHPSLARYVELARAHGLDPAQMALAFVRQRPFVTSVIIGATDMTQLAANIASADLALKPETLDAIEAIHKSHANPCV